MKINGKIYVFLLSTLFITIFILGFESLNAQQSKIKGKVVIWNDIPLANITITTKKSKQKTVSDSTGQFVISINKKDKLRFEADGFVNKRISVTPDDKSLTVKMTLISNNYSKESEIANHGFRFIPKKYWATAISHIEAEVATEMAGYTTVWDMIRGRCPGVVIRDNKCYMREGLSGSLNAQSVPAVVVIDGMKVSYSTLEDLDINNVKSVTLLKGGAAAVYGGAGGTGVVAIKTK